jgi:hypothetical protein
MPAFTVVPIIYKSQNQRPVLVSKSREVLVGLAQANSAAAVVPFNFVETEVEKAGKRLRTADNFDRK